MENIVLSSHSQDFLKKMEKQIPEEIRKKAAIRKLVPGPHFVDFLRYEIPDLVILHIAEDQVDYRALFQHLEEDPWLESVGFILILSDVEEQIETYKGFNISYFMNEGQVERNLERVVSILAEKREFLNYDSIIKKITSMTGEILIPTDLLLVQYYSSLFANYLFKEGYIDLNKKFSVKLSLEELLTNAMEHGNAGITYEEKTALQEEGKTVQDVMEERMSAAPWAGRKVTLQYNINPLSSSFTITDEGDGFDTSKLPVKEDIQNLTLAHGRGIFLSMNSCDELVYNKKGNQVKISLVHNGSAERTIPPGFIQNEPKLFRTSDVVFWENSTGDHIYYIVSGEYDVFVKGKKIARITPADVFMGEMSFLLGNRRTATVIAATAGKLVEISRQAFTDAVKNYPNYGIFLSKLLARRLRDANRLYAG